MTQLIITIVVPLTGDIFANAEITSALAPVIRRIRHGLEELNWTDDAACLSYRVEDDGAALDAAPAPARRGRGPNKPKPLDGEAMATTTAEATGND